MVTRPTVPEAGPQPVEGSRQIEMWSADSRPSGFFIRLRHRPDWVEVERYGDGRTGYCFNLSRDHATAFATAQEAEQFASAIPCELMVVAGGSR